MTSLILSGSVVSPVCPCGFPCNKKRRQATHDSNTQDVTGGCAQGKEHRNPAFPGVLGKNNVKEELLRHLFLVLVGISVPFGPEVRWSCRKKECGRVALSIVSRKQKQEFRKGSRAWYNWYHFQWPRSANQVLSHNSITSQWSTQILNPSVVLIMNHATAHRIQQFIETASHTYLGGFFTSPHSSDNKD